MYKVIEYFTDLQDDNFAYNVGDTFPREGKEVSAERFTELSTSANLRGVPLIEEVREQAEKSEPVEDAPKKRGRKKAE